MRHIARAAVAAFLASCSSPSDPAVVSEGICNTAERWIARPAPRLFLSPAILTRLKARAVANDPAWLTLKQRCDGYATGTMNPPNGNAYPNFPNVGQGHQGEEYVAPIVSLGLCFRVTDGTSAAQAYGAAGGRLLDAMSTPVSSGGQRPSTDSAHGIRNYGVGMAVGFDWLYPALQASTKQRVVTAINVWIDGYDISGFSREQPIGNHFAGYFFAKTAAALATEGDNFKATAYFDDVEQTWNGSIKPAYARFMRGGGWPEGWQYGPLSVRNMVHAMWAVKTAKNINWFASIPQARDQALYLSYFALPSLTGMDDQGTVRSGSKLAPSAALATSLATVLGALGDSSAPKARAFAAAVLANGDDRAAWMKFFYSDPGLPVSPYQDRPLSYVATGPGHVAVRSSWNTDAVWAAFSSGADIHAPDSGEHTFNQGSISITVGGKPILVNASAWLPRVSGRAGEDFVYDDSWGNRRRSLYNTFFVTDPNNPFSPGQASVRSGEATTRVERYEDWGGFVRARGANIEQAYRSTALRGFTRDFVFARPDTFVLFDRTRVTGSLDQWMAFHAPSTPKTMETIDATARRFDISDAGGAPGSIRALLPRNVSVEFVSLPGGVTRIEEHSRAAEQQWLTVISAGATVPEQVRLSPGDGNVTAGNVVGVHVQGSRNQVVLFPGGTSTTALTSSARYTVRPTADSDHMLIDVSPSAQGYAVTATAEGGAVTIDVKMGGPHAATPQGSLCFSVSRSGAVGACAFGPPKSIESSEPIPSPDAPSSSGSSPAAPVGSSEPAGAARCP